MKNNYSEKRFSKAFALLMAFFMIIAMMPTAAFAGEGESSLVTPAQDAVIYLTVNNQGIAASADDGSIMAEKEVTVKDLNEDGKLTVDEALQAAHAAYKQGGYATTTSEIYGVSVSKLWGVETTNTLFYVNGTGISTGVAVDTVKAGDFLYASVNKDADFYSDKYTSFDVQKKTVKVGESFTLTLTGAMSTGTTPLANIAIGTWNNGNFAQLETAKTDEAGKVTLSFADAGTYYVTANGTVNDTVYDYSQWPTVTSKPYDCPIMAPVAVVTVEAPKAEAKVTSQSGASTPKGGYVYNVGDQPETLKAQLAVDVDIDADTITYAWKSKTSPDSSYGSSASGTRNKQEYTPVAKKDGISYYYCTITYKYNDAKYTAETNMVPVMVLASEASVPNISTQPEDGGPYLVNATDAKALSVYASSPSDGGKLSYQWYVREGEGDFAKVEDATKSSYTPTADHSCVLEYYCEVTNTIESADGVNVYTASAKSETAKVIFQSAEEFGAKWTGDGTKENPYKITSQADLVKLAELCNGGLTFAGKYFEITADITLPEDWTPIGDEKEGKEIKRTSKVSDVADPFSGHIDGKNHLITVPEGGRPLIGVPAGASLSNLNIYGKKINGSGVVEWYIQGATITIDNVNLKEGTQTLKSGYIGGYASGANAVTIKNCTIEKNVVIGYSKEEANIGSFAGEYNGTIYNCVSYADVYGTYNVGGIAASKGQSMGTFCVQDCAFYGNVTATGNYVGGIVGAGYNGGVTSPNTPCVTIKNCYATGNIQGGNNVGGIFGGETSCRVCWPNGVGYIQNNWFGGTVKAVTSENPSVGGIIGSMTSLDRYNIISNNYYIDSCGAASGIGSVEMVITPEMSGTAGSGWGRYELDGAKYGRDDDPTGAGAQKLAAPMTAAQAADGSLVAKLNSGLNSSGDWIQDGDGVKFGGKRHLLNIACSDLIKMQGLTVYVNGDDVFYGKELTLTYNDGTTETVSAELASRDFEITEALVGKTIAGSILYNNQQMVFGMTIKAGGTPSVPKPDPENPGDANLPSNDITVSFTLLGDGAHGSSDAEHTFKANNLTTWIPDTKVTVSKDAKVMDVFAKILSQNRYSWMNDDEANSITGNYIQSITTPTGVTLAEFTNGKYSGWMYTLNGEYPLLGVTEQTLQDGDKIVFHYTDNYTVEKAFEQWNGDGTAAPTPGEDGENDTPETLTVDEVKQLVDTITPTMRSIKTEKKNIKVTALLNAKEKATVKQITDAGYTVKYNFYRSLKKNSGYKSMLIKDSAVYTNTKGVKNQMYYYKVRIQVYDEDGKLIARTALADCSYANRKWTK